MYLDKTQNLIRMQLSEIKQSGVILNVSKQLSALRAELNTAYSKAPPEIAEAFPVALDQVTDQQSKAFDAIIHLILTEDLTDAETTIRTAVIEAHRAAARAARSLADHHLAVATVAAKKLTKIPRDSAALFAEKRQLDKKFSHAVMLHEKDDIMAFEELLQIAYLYSEWSIKVEEDAIVGSQGIVQSDKKKIRLQWTAIILSTIAIIISVVVATINYNLSHSAK